MANLARRDSRTPEVKMLAGLVSDPWTLDLWLRQNWTIKPDPPEAEYIQAPAYQITCGRFSGDCDDAATLGASVLLALGYRALLVAIRPVTEPEFSHVFVRALPINLDIDPIVPASAIPLSYAEAITLEV